MHLVADSNALVSTWECNICFEESQNPVCTSCGHLFCWPCLHPWIHDMAKSYCPVCRSSLNGNPNIIPVYVNTQAAGPSQTANAAPIPPRPRPRESAGTPSASFGSNVVSLYLETLGHVCRQEVTERANLLAEVTRVAQMQSLVDADARSLVRVRRELKEMIRGRRNSALTFSGRGLGGQGSTMNSLSDGEVGIDRAHHTEVIRRVLNAILGRRNPGTS